MEIEKIVVKYVDGSEKVIKKGFAAELCKKELCVDRVAFSEEELRDTAFIILAMELFRNYAALYPEKMSEQTNNKGNRT